MAGEGNGSSVTFTVKELLARVDGKIDSLLIAVAQKADKHDLERLVERVVKLEAEDRARSELSTFQRWLIGTVVVGLIGAVATLTWLAAGG
jgi:hypothetical protein